MTATVEQATDDILTIFKAAWDPTGFVLDYENVVPADGATIPPDPPTPWARVAVRHATSNQSSLFGSGGKRRYTRTGTMMGQVFVPGGEGLQQLQSLCKILTDAFEGTASPRAVWFRNVRALEIGPDGDWFRCNVMADFTYDEIR